MLASDSFVQFSESLYPADLITKSLSFFLFLCLDVPLTSALQSTNNNSKITTTLNHANNTNNPTQENLNNTNNTDFISNSHLLEQNIHNNLNNILLKPLKKFQTENGGEQQIQNSNAAQNQTAESIDDTVLSSLKHRNFKHSVSPRNLPHRFSNPNLSNLANAKNSSLHQSNSTPNIQILNYKSIPPLRKI